MFRRTGIALALLGLAACSKSSPAVDVADHFVEAYFEHADQERAKEFTALGATQMLEEEAHEVSALRKSGYGPTEAGADVTWRRSGAPTTRDQRVRVPYEIVVHSGSGEVIREADVELADLEGHWKVVRVGLVTRP